MFKILSLLLLLGMTNAANKQPKDLLCDVCIDVVTDIDEWLTSDQTMDDIIHFVEGVRAYFSLFLIFYGRCIKKESKSLFAIK